MPSHGATSSIVHSPRGLDIPQLSDMYRECHCMQVAHAIARADSRVQVAIESKIERETQYARKSLGNIEAALIVEEAYGEMQGNSWNLLKRGVKSILHENKQMSGKIRYKILLFRAIFSNY